MSNFGRNFSAFSIKVKPQSPKEKFCVNTNNLINKCENMRDQNFELIKSLLLFYNKFIVIF